jgi:hypothetical protein
MDQLATDRDRFLDLIRRWHAGHLRGDQVDHCVNVMRWLDRALDLEPAPIAGRREMVLAALGHDLYEDSAIPPKDIVAGYGEEVDRLIRGLTEQGGDIRGYVERVASGPEEVRLIKLCDGIDNYGGLVEKGFVQSKPAWAVNAVRKHMEPMFSRLEGIPFRKFSVAGPWLNQILADKREQFWECICEMLQGRIEQRSDGHA